MGRENVLTYGKITLVSSGENVEKLMDHLDELLQKHGYPDTQHLTDDDDEFEKIEDELKTEGEKEMEQENERHSDWSPDV